MEAIIKLNIEITVEIEGEDPDLETITDQIGREVWGRLEIDPEAPVKEILDITITDDDYEVV